MGNSLEIPAEVFGGHSGNLGKLLECNAGGIVLFNIFKYRLKLLHMPERGFAAGYTFGIIFFSENKPEHFEQGTDDGQFIAGWLFFHSRKNVVDDSA